MPNADAFLDIYIGDQAAYDASASAYAHACALTAAHVSVYGLPALPEHLSDEQREILEDLNKTGGPLEYSPPPPLLAGRLLCALDPAPGLTKTRNNFLALCRGDKGMCKNAPNKPLHYLGCPVHRVVKGFIAQAGDITRGDGSGGESIYGGKFNDEKEGLRKAIKRGSLAMANSGKNSNTSQFFIVLAGTEPEFKKLKGKYVIFGEVIEGLDVVDRLDGLGRPDGKPIEKIWIGGCGYYDVY